LIVIANLNRNQMLPIVVVAVPDVDNPTSC